MNSHPLELGPLRRAAFLTRPNRFLVRCRAGRLGVVEAALANPGRMWELLFPGATLYLASAGDADTARSSPRKTKYTVVAVERDGSPIFLHTHLTNHVARWLIDRRRIPELARAQVVRSEVPAGKSRFDFLLQNGGRQMYLEVKSCTLFGNGVAMFPDAVTQRGRRHLLELAAHVRPRARPWVLFLVHTPHVKWFMPDYHTDLAFSQTLLEVRKKINILPVAIQWNEDLSIAADVKTLDIPWAFLRREVKDRGGYLLIVRLLADKTVQIGRLGRLRFRRGYYIYVGSAMRNLSPRIARHMRTRKKLHWHIDYLRQVADECVPLAIRSSARRECEIAAALSKILASGPKGFGSYDCDCPTHLFRHTGNPLEESAFHRVLQRYRMRAPGEAG